MEEIDQPDRPDQHGLGSEQDITEALTMLHEVLRTLEALPGLPDAGRDHVLRAQQEASAAARAAAGLAVQTVPVGPRIDFGALVQGLGGLLAAWLGPRARLDLQLSPARSWVQGDPVQLAHAMMLVIAGALAALRQGASTVRVATSLEPGGLRVRLDAAGRWLYPQHPDLIQAQAILLRHGGWLDWEEVESGTRVVISLPQATAPGEERPAPSVRPGRALVIDREADIGRLCQMVLRAQKFQVWVRRSLEEAQRLPPAEKVDLVIVDVERCGGRNLPGFLQLVGEHPSAGLILTATGLPSDWAAPEGRRWLMLPKPFIGLDLLGLVARLQAEETISPA